MPSELVASMDVSLYVSNGLMEQPIPSSPGVEAGHEPCKDSGEDPIHPLQNQNRQAWMTAT